jgi:hypothetical protein
MLFVIDSQPSNFGLEQTAHRLRQDMRHLEREAGLRERLRRAAAQAGCYTTRVPTRLHRTSARR